MFELFLALSSVGFQVAGSNIFCAAAEPKRNQRAHFMPYAVACSGSMLRLRFCILLIVVVSFAFAIDRGEECTEPNTMSDKDRPTVEELLSRSKDEIVTFLSEIYEHSAWVAEKLTEQDYSGVKTVSSLANAMKDIVNSSSRQPKMDLLRAHPDLCARVGQLEDLTASSQEEQSSAGLQSLTDQEMKKFTDLNTKYSSKFGFPFILAVRNSTKRTVLAALAGRVTNSEEVEFNIALQQVHKIAWMRLLASINTDDAAGFLTCHVLDTANGCPAANMRITLHRLSPTKELIGEYTTNDDGRLENGPALKGKDFMVGTYEWTFYVADYFAFRGTETAGTPFLDQVPLRFGIDNPDDHYHVPLLVSPWSFSTYRGS